MHGMHSIFRPPWLRRGDDLLEAHTENPPRWSYGPDTSSRQRRPKYLCNLLLM